MRTVALASARLHARRYVATLVAVVIGVSFVVVVNAFSSSARSGLLADSAAQYAGSRTVVTDVASLDRARRLATALPGRSSVNAVLYTSLSHAGHELAGFAAVGTVSDVPALRWQRLTAGRLPRGDAQAVMDEPTAKADHVSVGDRVRLGDASHARTVRVSGLVASSSGLLSGPLYLTPAGLDAFGSRVDVNGVITTSGDVSAVRALAPRGAEVASVDDFLQGQQRELSRGVDVVSVLLLVFAAIAFFVSALVIANTFSILIAQRVRDFALLRCVGASARQIRRSVLTEASVVGVSASSVGLVVGAVLGEGLVAAGRALWPAVPLGDVSLSWLWLLEAWLMGVLVTVVSCLVPARRSTRVSPLAALQPLGAPGLRTRAGVVRTVAGTVVAGAGVLLLALAVAGGSTVTMLAGGMVSFVGVLALAPVLVPAAVRLVGLVVTRTGLPGRLAVGNALSNPRRTAATAASLLVGVTLVSGLVVGMATVRGSIDAEVNRSYPIDAVLGARGALPDGLTQQVRAVDGIASVATLRGSQATVSYRGHRLGSLTVLGATHAAAGVAHGRPAFASPSAGQVFVPAEIMNRVDPSHASVLVTVGGHTARLTARGATGLDASTAVVSAPTLERLAPQATARQVWARSADGADAASVQASLTAVAEGTHATLAGALGQRAAVDRQLSVVTWAVLALLAAGVVISLIGIGNTLGLSVLERGREISLLRALGLTRGALRATLAVEGLLLAGVAGVLGVGLGTFYAWMGARTILDQALGSVTLSVPWGQLVLVVLLACLAGLVACVVPARQAARVAPAAGLSAD